MSLYLYNSSSMLTVQRHLLTVFFTTLFISCFVFHCFFNPWTYTQIHTPTVVQGRGGGGMKPLPGVFDMLKYFETILPLVESP